MVGQLGAVGGERQTECGGTVDDEYGMKNVPELRNYLALVEL